MTSVSATEGATSDARRTSWLIAFCALVGLVIGLVGFSLRSPTYEAAALVTINNAVGTVAEEAEAVTSALVTDAATTSLGYPPEVRLEVAENAGLVTIYGRGDSPAVATETANAVASIFVQSQTTAAASFSQPAEPDPSPVGQGRLVYALLGSLVGAALGLGLSYLRFVSRLRRPRSEPIDTADHRAEQRTSTPRPESASSGPFDDQRWASTSLVASAQKSQASPSPQPATPPKSSFATSILAADEAVVRAEPKPASTTSQGAFSFSAAMSEDAGSSAPPPPALLADSAGLDASLATGPAFLDDTRSTDPDTATGPDGNDTETELERLDRRALQAHYETARYELGLEHEQKLANLSVRHEHELAELRTEISTLNKRIRLQTVRLKHQAGNDQHRVGDLEAQVIAVEAELSTLRQQLENERIAHTRQLTEERGAADRALDNARREYRQELAKHTSTHRGSLSEHRSDLDRTLAEDRRQQAAALDAQHREYEQSLDAERERRETELAALTERFKREKAEIEHRSALVLSQQTAQHKDTIASLRGSTDKADAEVIDLQKSVRLFRAEVSTLQQKARHAATEHSATTQNLRDELAIARTELEAERERNAALREDVLRRNAEAHQAVDRALEDRTAQLSELEASVARQRDYADARVREVSAAAEERTRQAALREAELTATVSRLQRELDEARDS